MIEIDERGRFDWAYVLELAQVDETLHGVLHAFGNKPREEILVRAVVALFAWKKNALELMVKKCIVEPATIFLRDSVTPLKIQVESEQAATEAMSANRPEPVQIPLDLLDHLDLQEAFMTYLIRDAHERGIHLDDGEAKHMIEAMVREVRERRGE